MIYRTFEKLHQKTSLLGFGCMRLPVKDGKIDLPVMQTIIDKAFQKGVNYYDTAYMYHDGESEGAIGACLKKYPRDKFFIADKMPVWEAESSEDVEKIFDTQLYRLQMDYIDFYLVHSLTKANWEKAKKLKVVEFLLKKKEEGKIRFLGFSFHDTPEVQKEILNDYDWDFSQIQFNYIDDSEQRAGELYSELEKRGIPCIVMEPVKGGNLANPPQEVAAILKSAAPERSVASWALRWCAGFENVKVILSGMSSMGQVEDNLETLGNFTPLAQNEKAALDSAIEAIKNRPHIGCTGCRYCMPCPAGVNIPLNFFVYNEYMKYQNSDYVKWMYANDLKDADASKCVGCESCVTKCPQHLDIPHELKKVRSGVETLKNK